MTEPYSFPEDGYRLGYDAFYKGDQAGGCIVILSAKSTGGYLRQGTQG